MDFYYLCFFSALVATIGIFFYGRSKDSGSTSETTPEFRAFQRSYLIGFLLAMAGDWLQGPYVYALYSSYNYQKSDIATLFVAGFGSSMVFGTCVGSWADKMGRKKTAGIYCLVYIGSCLTKHFSNYWVLMLGRLLGGISTSLVYSVFDSWMVSEHMAKGFDPDWMKDTFSKAMIGNSCVAILSGVVAEYAAGFSPLSNMGGKFGDAGSFHTGGYTAPFDVAILVLVACFFHVTTWNENYGESKEGVLTAESSSSVGRFTENISKAFSTIMASKKIMLIGAIASLFEGSMFSFVFMWTPVMTGLHHDDIPFGLIFATFMLCCMGGSSLFNIISAQLSVSLIAVYMLGVATLALATPVFSTSYSFVFLAFLAFEVCVGIYWPSMGTMKGMHVPNAQRSAIYNVFRIPLNMIVLFVLEVEMNTSTVFMCIGGMLATAAYLMTMLHSELTGDDTDEPESGESDGETVGDDASV